MGWDSTPVSSDMAARLDCASVMFVGVRGSGETPPYGDTITSIRDALAQKWRGKGTVRQVYLNYPAADPHTLQNTPMSSLLFDSTMPSTEYFDSAALGAKKLIALLNTEKKQCPKEWVVLAGFSQGSQAITQALAQTDTPQRLAGAILVGNPDHYPGQNVQEVSGDADQSAIGMAAILYYLRERANATPGANRDAQMRAIIEATLSLSQNSINQKALDADMSKAGAAIPAEAYPETYSVCMKGDPVCDTAPALTRILTLQSTWQDELNQGRPIHMGYTRTVMEGALDRIAQRINAIGAAEAKGTPLPHGSTVAVTTRDWGPLQIGVAVGAGKQEREQKHQRSAGAGKRSSVHVNVDLSAARQGAHDNGQTSSFHAGRDKPCARARANACASALATRKERRIPTGTPTPRDVRNAS